MAKALGFDHIEVNTNGIRLANDIDYYKKLLDAGMSTIYLQFDTIDRITREYGGTGFMTQGHT